VREGFEQQIYSQHDCQRPDHKQRRLVQTVSWENSVGLVTQNMDHLLITSYSLQT